jgi:hypothetical protein
MVLKMLTVIMTEEGLEDGGAETPELNLNSRQPQCHVIDELTQRCSGLKVDFRLEPALDLSFSNNGDKRRECRDDTQDTFRSNFALGSFQDCLRSRQHTLWYAPRLGQTLVSPDQPGPTGSTSQAYATPFLVQICEDGCLNCVMSPHNRLGRLQTFR